MGVTHSFCYNTLGKAKWFVVRKPSTGGIIAKSANQIVLLKFRGRYKIAVLYYSPDPPVEVVKGGPGRDYSDRGSSSTLISCPAHYSHILKLVVFVYHLTSCGFSYNQLASAQASWDLAHSTGNGYAKSWIVHLDLISCSSL